MAYLIDARLNEGVPSLTLVDASSGEEKLKWHSNSAATIERSWQELFKRLVKLSCADKLTLVQQAKTPRFGDECLTCHECSDVNQTRYAPETHSQPLMLRMNSERALAAQRALAIKNSGEDYRQRIIQRKSRKHG